MNSVDGSIRGSVDGAVTSMVPLCELKFKAIKEICQHNF